MLFGLRGRYCEDFSRSPQAGEQLAYSAVQSCLVYPCFLVILTENVFELHSPLTWKAVITLKALGERRPDKAGKLG